MSKHVRVEIDDIYKVFEDITIKITHCDVNYYVNPHKNRVTNTRYEDIEDKAVRKALYEKYYNIVDDYKAEYLSAIKKDLEIIKNMKSVPMSKIQVSHRQTYYDLIGTTEYRFLLPVFIISYVRANQSVRYEAKVKIYKVKIYRDNYFYVYKVKTPNNIHRRYNILKNAEHFIRRELLDDIERQKKERQKAIEEEIYNKRIIEYKKSVIEPILHEKYETSKTYRQEDAITVNYRDGKRLITVAYIRLTVKKNTGKPYISNIELLHPMDYRILLKLNKKIIKEQW